MKTTNHNVVRFLIVANILVYLMWWNKGSDSLFMRDNFLVSWDSLAEGRWWTLITSVFSHSMFLHILINMIVLRDFGSVIEGLLGSRFFLCFYFLAGIFGSLCHAAVSALILGAPELPALGASGAVCGLVMLFSLLFPRQKILLFAIVPVPAILGAIALVGLDIWGVSAQAEGGGLPIGHGAHLGGALTGLVVYFLSARARLKRMRNAAE